MLAAARRFVEAGGPDGQYWAPKPTPERGTGPFSVSPGEFRTTMGLHIADTSRESSIRRSTKMTMNVYGHVTLDDKRTAMDRLGDLLGARSE